MGAGESKPSIANLATWESELERAVRGQGEQLSEEKGNRLQSLLESDPANAHFMLSRHSGRVSPDQGIVANLSLIRLLREGFKLTADNAIAGGWGGAGWVQKYVDDSLKTKFKEILVLGDSIDFFKACGPCVDELFMAHKGGARLTLVGQGASPMNSGNYLWLEIERGHWTQEQLVRKYGERLTCKWCTAVVGVYAPSEWQGTNFTVVGLIPSGKRANRTGASSQKISGCGKWKSPQ